jgi:hypothetical protein
MKTMTIFIIVRIESLIFSSTLLWKQLFIDYLFCCFVIWTPTQIRGFCHVEQIWTFILYMNKCDRSRCMVWQLFNVYKTWDIQIFQLFCQVNKTYSPTINVTSYSKEHMADGSNEPKHGINHWGASNKSY